MRVSGGVGRIVYGISGCVGGMYVVYSTVTLDDGTLRHGLDICGQLEVLAATAMQIWRNQASLHRIQRRKQEILSEGGLCEAEERGGF